MTNMSTLMAPRYDAEDSGSATGGAALTEMLGQQQQLLESVNAELAQVAQLLPATRTAQQPIAGERPLPRPSLLFALQSEMGAASLQPNDGIIGTMMTFPACGVRQMLELSVSLRAC